MMLYDAFLCFNTIVCAVQEYTGAFPLSWLNSHKHFDGTRLKSVIRPQTLLRVFADFPLQAEISYFCYFLPIKMVVRSVAIVHLTDSLPWLAIFVVFVQDS